MVGTCVPPTISRPSQPYAPPPVTLTIAPALLGNRPNQWVLNPAGAARVRVPQPAAPIELPRPSALGGLLEQPHGVPDIGLDVAGGLEFKGHRQLARVEVAAEDGIDDLRVPEQANHEGVTRLGHELTWKAADEQLEGRYHCWFSFRHRAHPTPPALPTSPRASRWHAQPLRRTVG